MEPDLPELTATLTTVEPLDPVEPVEPVDHIGPSPSEHHDPGTGPVAEARTAVAMLATATALTVAASGAVDGLAADSDDGELAEGAGLEPAAPSQSMIMPDEHVLALPADQTPGEQALEEINAAPLGDLATDSVFDERFDLPAR